MFITQLFEADAKRIIVTYPGRFQPFHKGHRDVFASLQRKFGSENVFIVTSNKTDGAKSPFNFSDKVRFMHAMGVPDSQIIESNNVYDLPAQFEPIKDRVVFISAVGAPDEKRLSPGRYKKDGTPGYFQHMPADSNEFQTADKHGYVIIAPEVPETVNIGGKSYDASHGTQTRELWNQVRNSPEQRKEFLQQLYGRTDPELGHILDKISSGAPAEVEPPAAKMKNAKKALTKVKQDTPLDENLGDFFVKYAQEKYPHALIRKNGQTIQDFPADTKPAAPAPVQYTQQDIERMEQQMASLQAEYKKLGGDSWQYADRMMPQDIEARDIQSRINYLARNISVAKKSLDVDEGSYKNLHLNYKKNRFKSLKKINPFNENDVDESLYQYDREDPYNSEFAPDAGMGRMTLRGWKQSMIRRVKEFAAELERNGEHLDNAAMWEHVYKKLKNLNLDPIAQEIELAHQELERIRRQGGIRSRAFKK